MFIGLQAVLTIIKDQVSSAVEDRIRSNFDMLRAYESGLWRLGSLAKKYFAEDPNISLLKSRQVSWLLAQFLSART